MMNVSEYASDVGLSVKEILDLCQKLEINITSEEDMLSDDDIIMLDNEIASFEENTEESEKTEEIESSEDEEYSYDEEIEEVEEKTIKKRKPTKNIESKNDFKVKRKEMYKHKEKLKSNLASEEEDIILYKDNMTVADLASSLNVNPTQIIKKIMSLGMTVTINGSLDFDTAELIVSDYNKTL